MNQGLFRKQALTRFMRIDSPGAIISVAPPSTVLAFGAMAALVLVLGALAAFGRSQLTAEGRGVVRPNQPSIVLRAPFAGTVLAIPHPVGEHGRQGEIVMELDVRAERAASTTCSTQLTTERSDLAALEQRLEDLTSNNGGKSDPAMALVLISQMRAQREKVTSQSARCDALAAKVTKSRVTFPVDATLADLAVAADSHVQEGDVLATLEPKSAELVGYLEIPERYRAEIAVGQPVRVKFDALPFDEVGAGTAHVTRVLDTLPSGVKLDTDKSPGGVVLELGLDAMPAGARAEARARSGMSFTGSVLTRQVRVANLLFGG